MASFFALVAVLAVLNPSCVEGCGGCGSRRRSSSRSRPSPVNGGWSSWSSWNSCSGRLQTKRRSCNNPSPANGGRSCSGSSTEDRDCNECYNSDERCDHRCINYYGGYRCECYSGYRLQSSKKCVPITCDISNWPSPSNGQLSSQCSKQSQVDFDTTCTVTCDYGYKIVGPSFSRCTSDGSWYPKQSPNCRVRECKALSPPDKGDITPDICKTKPLHGQRCLYKCSLGYTRTGPSSTKCNNGHWTHAGFHCRDTQRPTFLTCPSAKNVTANKGQTTAMVTWAPVKATDNDNVPIAPQPSPYVTSPHEFPEGAHTVVYTATDQSNNNRLCYFKVNVHVLRCPVFTPPANGRLETGTCGNVYGSACRWQCDKGYKQRGTKVRYCEKIPGTNQVRWTGTTPSCEAVKCPPLNSPDNAVIGCSSSYPSYGTLCILSCKRGYETVGGSTQRTCQENQKWSGAQLQCQAVSCTGNIVKSEGLIIKPHNCAISSASLVYGTECRFTCKSGYQLRGPGLKTCAQHKNWVPMANPSCKDISGPTFLNCPSNIVATADRGTTAASVTWTPPKATDNSGVIPNIEHSKKQPGDRFSAGEHTIRYLATDRTGNVGECKFKILVSVVRCLPRLYSPGGGAKNCTKDNIYGSECSFKCETGHTMLGSAKRVCEKASFTGFWTGKEAKCELVRCPRLHPPPHSKQSGCGIHAMYNVFGDKCLFYCDIGYRQIEGSTERVCQADGTWSGKAPNCQVVRCSSLQAPNNGNVSPSSCTTSPEYGTTCRFSCRKGYRLQGELTASCLRDGQWSKNTSVFCKDVESPSFGFTCPGDIKHYADRAKNYTTAVIWSKVIATDNSGVTPTMSISGLRSIYYVGRHPVVYKARDDAGNYKRCSFYVTILALQCPTLRPPPNGPFLVGDCDNTYGSTCRMKCQDGYDLFGASKLTCEAKPGHVKGYWDNPIPICKVRKCSPLKAPKFGYIYPFKCTSSPVSGTACYFQCKHGCLDNDGANMTYCGTDGKWTINESSILKCRDVTPPIFRSCPSDIRANLDANASVTVNWKIPVALDNSDQAPQITVSPAGISPPYTFQNTTVIVYTATDASGNKEECAFQVLLEDNSGPVVVYCPADQDITATQIKTIVTWKSPQFKDNSNGALDVKCNHHSGTAFYWGTWNVHCRAYDNNPNNNPADCQFTIRLTAKECIEWPPPKNGAKVCDDWILGRMCSPSCNKEWDFTQPLPYTVWSCGISGRWLPSTRWPDCSKEYRAKEARMAMDVHYHNGDCSHPFSQEEIKQNFIETLNGSIYPDVCRDPLLKDKCKVENVRVKCALVEFILSRRLRRASDKNVDVGKQRSRLIPQTTISLDIVVPLDNSTGVNDTKQIKKMAGLVGVKIAKNIGSEIKKAVENGSLSLNVRGTVFVPDIESLNISEPERKCDTGQAYKDGVCVSCSPGTYLNKTFGRCEDCPIGSYQEQDSQERCVLCPPKTSTEDGRTDNRSHCIALCKPGTYSPTGLEPCIQCEKGFYQELEGQRLCIKCSSDRTTPDEGSNSSKQCGVPCPSGSFSSTGLAPCSLCNRRAFQPHNESRICIPCPGTTVTAHSGSKSSQDCKEIDNCDSNPCKGNLACTDLIDDFLCTCQPGFTGKQCETNIDDCQDQPCFNNGTCHDLVNNYTCTCAQGYQGFNCEDDVDECISSLCSNNGSCSNIAGGYNCQCEPGFTGELCEAAIDECLLFPCQNGATCKDGINNYTCLCAMGYQGNDCEENINDCASDPCQNEARCVDEIGSYHCICPAGFYGKNCEQDIDECENIECENNAVCVDQVNGFHCICREGFTGKNCELNIDECGLNPCLNEARCVDKINGYQCECKDGFDGLQCERNIDDCASNPCSNNGSCHDGVSNFTCVCPPGFTGNTCSLDIDYCALMPCLNDASCFDGRTSFICQCLDGFKGDRCQYNIDECQNATCFNNGTCVDGIDEYSCVCPAGFTGFNCEINIDECAQNPCINEGTCTDLVDDFQCTCKSGYTGKNCSVDINACSSSPCRDNGTCVDKVGGFTCSCIDGFSGRYCEVNTDDCLLHACTNGATCRDGINSYTCDCPPGFFGKFCESEVDECESFPCLYGGTCYDQINAFYCACRPGFTGQRCERNIDDCESRPCMNNGICTDLVGGYSCSCSSGFTGRHCENRIDYCEDANCSQNGDCVNSLTGFSCKCRSGYFGKSCEFELDECLARPCFNNATCHDAINSFTCSCAAGFTGRYCELNIDDCVDNACQNNGTCIDHTLGYSCLCAEGYTGTFCQTDVNDCESAPCQNNGTCIDQTPGFSCRCLDRFIGENCEYQTDPCLSALCQNGGTCQAVNSTGNITCLCKTGFTGKNCDVNVDECASEPCMPNSNCIDLIDGYECECYPSYTGDHCDIFLGSNFDLIFKRLTTKDMVVLSNGTNVPDMDSLTIALFVRADPAYSSGTLFSYSVLSKPTELITLSFKKSQLELAIKDKVVRADFELADDLWHYVGVVWNGITGYVSVYVDGPQIKQATNVLKGDTVAGGGLIVLGQQYLAGKRRSVLTTGFVGTLHQVNLWNVAANPDHMWNAAHNCTWPIAGSVLAWTDFLQGLKGKVEKRFMTQCKALPMCTTNCSHFVGCESRHGFYYCNCQPGFSGPHCNMNIDECSLSPCINGRCVDGVNRYDCICDEGYWGTNCEKKINEKCKGECSRLPEPLNGRKSCEEFSGRKLCTMTCNEGFSHETRAITTFACGPDTKWRWNSMADVKVPACSRKAEPKEIKHRFIMSFRDIQCEVRESYNNFRSAFEREVSKTLSTIPGCLDSCKLKDVTVPGCGWKPNQKERRSVTDAKKVLFSLNVKGVDPPSLAYNVEEKSEAVLFQMQYAVSTGQFRISLHGVNSTADRSSFQHVSAGIACYPGFVRSIDRKECVACPVGTFHRQTFSTCTPCPKDTYQDEEGNQSCKPCGEGEITHGEGGSTRKNCFVERSNL